MQHRIIAITAGASGIGRAIALALAARGALVHVCDADADAVAALAQTAPAIRAMVADVTDEAQMAAWFGAIGSRIDAVIANAGIAGPTARCEDVTGEDWARTIEVNLNGAHRTIRLAIPRLRRGSQPAIVIMASNAGLFGCPLRSPYVASKWALIGLTKTLAMELGPEDITVNAICPASVEGPRIEGVIARDAASRGMSIEEVSAEYRRQSSMRRFIRPEDIIAMVEYLLSDAARSMSGQALAIDGHTEGLWLDLEPVRA